MTMILLAVLAAFGLAELLWLIFGALLVPAGTPENLRITVLASGNGDAVEHTLRGLAWLQAAGMIGGRIEVRDAGLNGGGRAQVQYLLKQYPGVVFAPEIAPAEQES